MPDHMVLKGRDLNANWTLTPACVTEVTLAMVETVCLRLCPEAVLGLERRNEMEQMKLKQSHSCWLWTCLPTHQVQGAAG